MPSGRKTEGVTLNKFLPRLETTAERGLTALQAKDRLENGYANENLESPAKTVGQIFKDNLLTYFNLIFVILAVCVISVGAYNNLTFMPVVFANAAIGIIQELRSKRALGKIKIVSSPAATVIRDGERRQVPSDKTVIDDIVIFSAGKQIFADAVILSGECQVNEALVTGEADEITKASGDYLLSGSFVVSGECYARLDRVGRDSFVSQLSLEAGKTTNKKKSGMMFSLKRLVQFIGIVIVPFGIILYIQQTKFLDRDVTDSVLSTVAALIGMIPEGLYLLVSIALTVGVLRLARRKTLVHELGCIETLARVDVLCVDKTGTITESTMDVQEVVPLCEDRFNLDDLGPLLTDYVASMGSDNETMLSLKAFFGGSPTRIARKTMAFSSAKKYSGASFSGGETFLLGAPDMILRHGFDAEKTVIEKYSAQGFRVLLFALYDGGPEDAVLSAEILPLCLILLANRIRPEAPATFRFFAAQNVAIKVISGDNPVTVSRVACDAGITDAEKYVDATTLTTERKIKRAVDEFTVFGRVTPDQKRKLIRALKAAKHTVAMTGDGVNDVLALKDADCSIAMASGSDIACQVSQIVLMDSNFASMPYVVMEGRRVINNIERSASLYLVKNIFSFIFAVITMAFTLTYPIMPTQLTLFNVLLIGIPSFVLALEPNRSLVRGKFLINVITSAIPAAFTNVLAVLAVVLLSGSLGIPTPEMSTMATVIISFVGFMMLFKLCRPLNSLRIALIVTMAVCFILGILIAPGFFELSRLTARSVWLLLGICAASVPIMLLLSVTLNTLKKQDVRPKR